MYYMNFKDLCLGILKSLIITFIIFILIEMFYLDCKIGISFCNFMNIPEDFTFTYISPGMAYNISFILYVAELILIYYGYSFLKKFNAFNDFCDFLSFDI